MHFTFSFRFQKPTGLFDPPHKCWLNDGLLLEGKRGIKDQWRHLEWVTKVTPPSQGLHMLFLQAKLVQLSLYFITKTRLRKLSSVSCPWSVTGDTAWQQTLHLGFKEELLCMPAQVASWLSLLDMVSHVSSFHDNFKEVNIIGKYMEVPNSKNLTEVCWGWITAITLFV